VVLSPDPFRSTLSATSSWQLPGASLGWPRSASCPDTGRPRSADALRGKLSVSSSCGSSPSAAQSPPSTEPGTTSTIQTSSFGLLSFPDAPSPPIGASPTAPATSGSLTISLRATDRMARPGGLRPPRTEPLSLDVALARKVPPIQQRRVARSKTSRLSSYAEYS
jgi:hypothetical protein